MYGTLSVLCISDHTPLQITSVYVVCIMIENTHLASSHACFAGGGCVEIRVITWLKGHSGEYSRLERVILCGVIDLTSDRSIDLNY